MNKEQTATVWSGCYDGSWKGLITDESFSHPAKYSRNLIRRIYEYLRDEIGLPKGSVVVDPFGGVALGAMDAMDLGYAWYGLELESKFHKLGNANIELWKRCHPDGVAVLCCGDSRKLCEILGPAIRAATACVGSPPFQNSDMRKGGSDILADWAVQNGRDPNSPSKSAMAVQEVYGTTYGQLGAMPEGDVSAVLSSPPYADASVTEKRQFKSRFEMDRPEASGCTQGYGLSEDNLGNLPAGDVSAVCGSPPFIDPRGAVGRNEQPELRSNRQGFGPGITNEYGESEGQLSGLPEGDLAEVVVSSPPYANSDQNYSQTEQCRKRLTDSGEPITGCGLMRSKHSMTAGYGDTEGNLAQLAEGDLAAALISSPPYADRCVNDNQRTMAREGLRSGANEGDGGTYGDAEGNLAALPEGCVEAVVGSPPFSERHSYNDPEKEAALVAKMKQDPNCRIGGDVVHQVPGTSPGQLAIMPTGELSDAIVSSPPWQESLDRGVVPKDDRRTLARSMGISNAEHVSPIDMERIGKRTQEYGDSPGQLGTMEAGELASALVSSPPFYDNLAKVSPKGIGSDEYAAEGVHIIEKRIAWAELNHEAFGAYLKERRTVLKLSKAEMDRRLGTNTAYSFWEGRRGSKDQWRIPLPTMYRKVKEILGLDDRYDSVLLDTEIVEVERRAMSMGHKDVDYGSSPGQLAGMMQGSLAAALVSSPPYAGCDTKPTALGTGKPTRDDGDGAGRNKGDYVYGDSEGQLGSLPAGELAQAVLTSPPYEGSVNAESHGIDWSKAGPATGNRKRGEGCKHEETLRSQLKYADKTEGQLGATESTTFWEAARDIVRQAFLILRPGGVAVWVVKAFCRAGAIVDFPGDWRKLCEACGFEFVEEIHASLVKLDEHPGLFGEPVVKKKSRKSFFRRLHEAKRPDLAIDYEVVLVMRKQA